MRFVDLFAGMGGFHYALASLGHECVFASEIDDELRSLYKHNFPLMEGAVLGDIRLPEIQSQVPPHDVLCGGFPCQPFSKGGSQNGFDDQTRGTLFHEISAVLAEHEPSHVILENVGNFARHDGGRTWRIVQERLQELGYNVIGTEHICNGGHGLISPHHLGFPHHRERFFIVATRSELPDKPFPPRDNPKTSLDDIIQGTDELSVQDREETSLSKSKLACIEHWATFLDLIPSEIELPSTPIWGDEIEASYPFEDTTPYALSTSALRLHVNGNGSTADASKEELLAHLPSYAQRKSRSFPRWKRRFIRENREWFDKTRTFLPDSWIDRLYEFPQSFRKLEWNCKSEERNLWNCVLQFRPSGLRAKRYDTIPSLVSMTTTQIPVLGPERRQITRVEGLRLQGFPDDHQLPKSRADAFSALGNAVHVGVVTEIAERILGGS